MKDPLTFEAPEEELDFLISHIKVIVRPVNKTRQSNLLAVAEVQFLNEDGFVVMKVRGFRIAEKTFPNGIVDVKVDFPSYTSGGRYFKAFIAERDCDFYRQLSGIILNAYYDFEREIEESYQLESEAVDIF